MWSWDSFFARMENFMRDLGMMLSLRLGKYHYEDGSVYEEEFFEDSRQGQGLLRNANGDIDTRRNVAE
jgi:hypothetical protein